MLGFIARCDNTGLGVESLDFVRHMQPDKVLVAIAKVLQDFPERYARCPDAACLDRFPTPEEADRFLDGLDTVFCIESPYDWSLLVRARARGVRTILRINYEYLPDPLEVTPDVLVAPIDWYQPDGTVILPFPVDRRRFPFRKRTRARVFLHVTGRQGKFGRNGTKELLEAIPLVRSDVRFIIHSQLPLPAAVDSDRVEWRVGDAPDNAALYAEGDVFVLPRRYGGQALPMNEALSVGMPVMMTDMAPQNRFLPRDLLIPCQSFGTTTLDRSVESAVVEPAAIAATIDKWANRDISEYSQRADALAESISWETLGPRYRELLRPRRSHRSSKAAARNRRAAATGVMPRAVGRSADV